jgi:purine-binding chemotaxis protein CheW
MPPFMLDVINLRGKAVPLADMRLLLDIEVNNLTSSTCIIITEIVIEDQHYMMGGLADSVNEVSTINATEIEPPPSVGTYGGTGILLGMVQKKEGFMMYLDVDRIFKDGGEFLRRASEMGVEGKEN